MNPTIKTILAALAGIITSFIVVFLVEGLGHLVYPPPADLDMGNPVAMAEYVQGLPIGAMLFVLAAWLSGIVGGGVIAKLMMPQRAVLLTSIVGVVIWIASGFNLSAIPHPFWFAITAHLGIPVVTIATGLFLRQKK